MYKGNYNDFTNFHFGEKCAKDFNLVRISDGDRYKIELSPQLNNKSVDVPGGDGAYYFGSTFKNKTISIQFAFDNLSEKDIADLKKWLYADRKLKELWFDETPWKFWKAKIASVPSISTVCFDQGDNHRVYKGEGSVEFQLFNPFAQERAKYLSNYGPEDSTTATIKIQGVSSADFQDYLNEWSAASGLMQSKTVGGVTYDTLLTDGAAHKYNCKNCGDLEADWILTLGTNGRSVIGIDCGNHQLNLTIGSLENGDTTISINSKLNLIEGGKIVSGKFVKTGNVYNNFITSGEFFKLPVNDSESKSEFKISGLGDSTSDVSFEYHYKYL